MRKVTETTEIVKNTKTTIFCDDCGEPTVTLTSCNRKSCKMCGADLCKKCIGYVDSDTGDYYDIYCNSCWDSGGNCRKKIQELEEQIDREYETWKCIGKIERKKLHSKSIDTPAGVSMDLE